MSANARQWSIVAVYRPGVLLTNANMVSRSTLAPIVARSIVSPLVDMVVSMPHTLRNPTLVNMSPVTTPRTVPIMSGSPMRSANTWHSRPVVSGTANPSSCTEWPLRNKDLSMVINRHRG